MEQRLDLRIEGPRINACYLLGAGRACFEYFFCGSASRCSITLVLEQGLGRLTFRNSERFYTANLSDQAWNLRALDSTSKYVKTETFDFKAL